MKSIIVFFLTVLQCSAYASMQEKVSLKSLLEIAYQNNPSIAAMKSNANAEESSIVAKYTMDDPMIGIATLDRGNTTKYGVISQKIRFPMKYYLDGKAQSNKASSLTSLVQLEKLKVKRKLSFLYFSLLRVQNVTALTSANMDAVREFARVAEKKYSAGKAPQSDSMKAHFEQTRLELDLIQLEQEENSIQHDIKALLNDKSFPDIKLSNLKVSIPSFDFSKYTALINSKDSELTKTSPLLKSSYYLMKEAEWKRKLAKWEFAPDIQLQYQGRISGDPQESEIFSINFTLPLYFWKKSAMAEMATSMADARQYRLKDQTLQLKARINNLAGQVLVGEKTLKVYTTSLIPQAQGAYNSSKASYRANKNSFLDLLDSERSLYQVKTNYYRALQQYVKSLSLLEEATGICLSNLGEE